MLYKYIFASRFTQSIIESPPKSPNFQKAAKFGGLLTIRKPEFMNSEPISQREIFSNTCKRLFGEDSLFKAVKIKRFALRGSNLPPRGGYYQIAFCGKKM